MKLKKNKLIGYSALAATFMTLATDADAQVIYTDVDPDLMLDEVGEKLAVDLDQDGVNDILFQKNLIDLSFPYVISSNTYQIYYGIDLVRAKIAGEHSLAGTYSSYGYNALPFALSEGDVIDGEQDWLSASDQMMQRSILLQVSTESGFSFTSSFGNGYFTPGNSDLYLGVKMKVDKNNYFGWVRVDLTSDGHLIVKDHALNLTDGASIEAGEMGEPLEVQTLNDNTVNAYSYNETLYVVLQTQQQEGIEAKLFNLNGSLMFEKLLFDGTNSMNLPHTSAGIYTLQLSAPDGSFVKKINLQ
ncbi:MAG: T9SS type A sorting domain-containing protein [Chitinophagales bacterium]